MTIPNFNLMEMQFPFSQLPSAQILKINTHNKQTDTDIAYDGSKMMRSFPITHSSLWFPTNHLMYSNAKIVPVLIDGKEVFFSYGQKKNELSIRGGDKLYLTVTSDSVFGSYNYRIRVWFLSDDMDDNTRFVRENRKRIEGFFSLMSRDFSDVDDIYLVYYNNRLITYGEYDYMLKRDIPIKCRDVSGLIDVPVRLDSWAIQLDVVDGEFHLLYYERTELEPKYVISSSATAQTYIVRRKVGFDALVQYLEEASPFNEVERDIANLNYDKMEDFLYYVRNLAPYNYRDLCQVLTLLKANYEDLTYLYFSGDSFGLGQIAVEKLGLRTEALSSDVSPLARKLARGIDVIVISPDDVQRELRDDDYLEIASYVTYSGYVPIFRRAVVIDVKDNIKGARKSDFKFTGSLWVSGIRMISPELINKRNFPVINSTPVNNSVVVPYGKVFPHIEATPYARVFTGKEVPTVKFVGEDCQEDFLVKYPNLPIYFVDKRFSLSFVTPIERMDRILFLKEGTYSFVTYGKVIGQLFAIKEEYNDHGNYFFDGELFPHLEGMPMVFKIIVRQGVNRFRSLFKNEIIDTLILSASIPISEVGYSYSPKLIAANPVNGLFEHEHKLGCLCEKFHIDDIGSLVITYHQGYNCSIVRGRMKDTYLEGIENHVKMKRKAK